MSDLRDRIAAAIENHHPDPDNYPDLCMCGYECWKDEEVMAYRFHVADAVIAELGLIRDPFSTVAFQRYVTQWQPNERFAPYCNRCGIPHTDDARCGR